MSIKELEKINTEGVTGDKHKLILYNSSHFWDDVVSQLQKATGFDILQCDQIAMIAHTKGKAVVMSGELEKLSSVESILKEIQLKTEIK